MIIRNEEELRKYLTRFPPEKQDEIMTNFRRARDQFAKEFEERRKKKIGKRDNP